LQRQTRERKAESGPEMPDLFGDFNGLPLEARTEFYAHNQHWSNRMISGDSLSVMASLAVREGLLGQVQCIYIDPPYGIKFNSNFQWSTTSRDVKDGARDSMTREPEQVRAFRDTWRDGIHSYLTYLRDRLTVARDLLTESGSIFVQIGDENVHRVRALMDEVFGEENFVSQIQFVTTSGFPSLTLSRLGDFALWYCRDKGKIKYRQLYASKNAGDDGAGEYRWLMLSDGTTRAMTDEERNGRTTLPVGAKRWRFGPLTSSGASLLER
jgi:adenine-specific DNA-methyltransferase